jgi:hypothetical protein
MAERLAEGFPQHFAFTNDLSAHSQVSRLVVDITNTTEPIDGSQHFIMIHETPLVYPFQITTSSFGGTD